jgi:hypothetical protein
VPRGVFEIQANGDGMGIKLTQQVAQHRGLAGTNPGRIEKGFSRSP